MLGMWTPQKKANSAGEREAVTSVRRDDSPPCATSALANRRSRMNMDESNGFHLAPRHAPCCDGKFDHILGGW